MFFSLLSRQALFSLLSTQACLSFLSAFLLTRALHGCAVTAGHSGVSLSSAGQCTLAPRRAYAYIGLRKRACGCLWQVSVSCARCEHIEAHSSAAHLYHAHACSKCPCCALHAPVHRHELRTSTHLAAMQRLQVSTPVHRTKSDRSVSSDACV